MWHLVRGLAGLLHSWWQRDRVRASPREGRLLGLPPRCILLIDGDMVEVVNRAAERRGRAPAVVYRCRTRTGSGRLHVTLVEPGQECRVRWHEDGRVRELAEDSVEIFRPV